MPKVAVILANGFEEIEALTVVESCVAQYHLPYGRIW